MRGVWASKNARSSCTSRFPVSRSIQPQALCIRSCSSASKTAAKTAKAPAKTARQSAPGTLRPSQALATVIGNELVSRAQVTKKLWDYIKAQGLQDPKDKRTIRADAKLQAVFGKPQANMFELAGIVGQHLG